MTPLNCEGNFQSGNNNSDMLDKTQDDEAHMLSEEAKQLTDLFGF